MAGSPVSTTGTTSQTPAGAVADSANAAAVVVAKPPPLQTARWSTMILGLLAVAVICPLVQWLEMGGTEAQSFAPMAVPPVAVAMLVGLVLAVAVAALIKKFSPRADFVLLYAMLSIATLLCSSGLVRSVYGHITCVMDELLARKVDTVRVGYESQNPAVFPKLATPLMPDMEEMTVEQRAARDRAYADLIEFSNQLRRDPRDVPPTSNHADPRYDLRGKNEFAADVTRLDWWWRERFKRDAFGSLKKDVDAWRDIQHGATTDPVAGLAGYPQPLIDRLAAHPPGPMEQWLSDSLLSDISATHAKTIATGGSPSAAPKSVPETRTIPWHIWGWPILNWSFFCFLIVGLLTCLAEVFRRVWLRIQNLPMPLVEVPDGIFALLPNSNATRSARLGLLGGIAFGLLWVSLHAGAHFRVPGFTFFSAGWGIIDLTPAFASPPWNYMSTVWLCWSPLLICIGLLVSLEVSRSIWATTWLCNIALVILGAVGISAATVATPQQLKGFNFRDFPFWDDQVAGAMIVFTLWMLWTSRGPLLEVLAGLWKKPDPAKIGEPLIGPRLLPWLLVFLLIAIPCQAWYMGATSVKFLVMLLGLFLTFTIAAARLRAETGFIMAPALTTMSRYNLMFGGARTFGAGAASAGNSFFFLASSAISVVLPQQLEIVALAQRQRVSLRRLAVGMMLAALVALAVSMPCFLIFQYGTQGGVSTMMAREGMAGARDSMYLLFRFGGRNLDQGRFETVRLVATAVGGVIMFALLFCRARFTRFPLHPIGYLATAAFVTGQYINPTANYNIIWGPMLLAWLIKRSVFKIGGAELFQRFLPLIRGTIIGHLLAIVLWAFIRKLLLDTNDPMYFTW